MATFTSSTAVAKTDYNSKTENQRDHSQLLLFADCPGRDSTVGIQVNRRKSRLSVKQDFDQVELHRRAMAKLTLDL